MLVRPAIRIPELKENHKHLRVTCASPEPTRAIALKFPDCDCGTEGKHFYEKNVQIKSDQREAWDGIKSSKPNPEPTPEQNTGPPPESVQGA
jgi:hypothetical protein